MKNKIVSYNEKVKQIKQWTLIENEMLIDLICIIDNMLLILCTIAFILKMMCIINYSWWIITLGLWWSIPTFLILRGIVGLIAIVSKE